MSWAYHTTMHQTLWLAVLLLPTLAVAQKNCKDAGDEPNHRLIHSAPDVRVYELELGRLKATEWHCHANSFLRIATTDTRTTTTHEGQGPLSWEWTPGEARFVYGPVKHTVRNDGMLPHREIVIETLHTVQRPLFEQNTNTDEFGADPGEVKPSWSVTFTRGGLTATKTQLAPGDSVTVNEPDQLLIAITDAALKGEVAEKEPETVELGRGETVLLRGGVKRKLSNAGRAPVRFIVVEF